MSNFTADVSVMDRVGSLETFTVSEEESGVGKAAVVQELKNVNDRNNAARYLFIMVQPLAKDKTSEIIP
jgi:hypothetical protein